MTLDTVEQLQGSKGSRKQGDRSCNHTLMDSPLPHGKIYQNGIAKWVVPSDIQVKWKGEF